MRSYTLFKPFLLGTLITTLAACGLGGVDAANSGIGAGNGPKDPESNAGYYRARPNDQGGFMFRLVNQPVTPCADGTTLPECYVADIDTVQLQLDQNSNTALRTNVNDFLLRGSMTVSPSTWSVFHASEAWRGHPGQVATGTYVRATSSGIVCITYPCMSFTAVRLNSTDPPWNVADVSFNDVGKVEDAQAQLHRPEGILTAVVPTTVNGPGGTAAALAATEYYLPFSRVRDDGVSTGSSCGGRGLPACPIGMFCLFDAKAECGRADQPGTCTVPPQICTKEYNPVCGCDGQTYANGCSAAAASTSVDHAGECQA